MITERPAPIATYRCRLEPPSANPQGEVTFSLLVRWLLEAATQHAESWQVGYSTLIGQSQGWVLARMAVEMETYPSIYEEVEIETWIEGFNPHFSSRNFCVKRSDGHIYGHVRSIWSVIDMVSRTSVDLNSFARLEQYASDRACPIGGLSKIRSVTVENPVSYAVRYTDLDLNRHMNSIKYIEHMLDLFPLEQYDRNRMARFEINYVSETLDKSVLQVHHRAGEKGEVLIEIKNSDSVGLCRGKIIFLPRIEKE